MASPDDFGPHLFDRFTQASMGINRTARWTGLGLSVSKTLANVIDGELRYEPTERGACFVLDLPTALLPD
ncbi:MAG: K+-sensing histidine kinase KdpD [Glaciecola sp.]|jgi:K+-sensing histidine kinase KdpD